MKVDTGDRRRYQLTAMPKLSVGLPVYNGAQYLDRAVASLVAQTFDDLEILISDNASTDDTAAICQRWAATDRRIRYVRQERNLGALANFKLVLHGTSGEFFHWASHDDRWHPNFAATAIAALERRPDAAWAMGRVRYVGADDVESRAPDVPPYHCDVADRADRLGSYFINGPTDTLIYGLFRRSALIGAPFVLCTCPEKMLLAHALLQGPVIDVEGMEYTCLLVEKDHETVARTIGIDGYTYRNEAALYHGMVKVLRSGLSLAEFLRVYPAFALKNNWHKFFAKAALRRVGLIRA